MKVERFDTVVIGGGQAGLAMGYYLKEQGRHFTILDAGERIGGTWRKRWGSLRLFTPAALSGLPGMSIPFPGGYFPTKDEMADYFEEYARKFDLPVRLSRHVCGRQDSSLTSAGSSHPSSARTATPSSIGEWWRAHQACTSWGYPSSTRSPRR